MKSNASFQGETPVLMSSSCDIVANNSALPQSDHLTYPFRKAVMIEEIRYTMRISGTGGILPNMGALVSTKLQLGQLYLMRDQVPVWLLGTMMATNQEEGRDTLLTSTMSFSHYRWRLPEPLYVEAGQVLSSAFFRGIDGFGSINIHVAYVGRTVAPDAPRPSVLAVPYVAPFVTTVGQAYQQSNEFNLFNPFDKPLRVQRLTGRVLSFVSATTASGIGIKTPVTAQSTLTILMDDSWGGKMINNNTGPGDAFDSLRGAWTVDTVMPAKGIYVVKAWNIPAATSLHVAVVGVREERL